MRALDVKYDAHPVVDKDIDLVFPASAPDRPIVVDESTESSTQRHPHQYQPRCSSNDQPLIDFALTLLFVTIPLGYVLLVLAGSQWISRSVATPPPPPLQQAQRNTGYVYVYALGAGMVMDVLSLILLFSPITTVHERLYGGIRRGPCPTPCGWWCRSSRHVMSNELHTLFRGFIQRPARRIVFFFAIAAGFHLLELACGWSRSTNDRFLPGTLSVSALAWVMLGMTSVVGVTVILFARPLAIYQPHSATHRGAYAMPTLSRPSTMSRNLVDHRHMYGSLSLSLSLSQPGRLMAATHTVLQIRPRQVPRLVHFQSWKVLPGPLFILVSWIALAICLRVISLISNYRNRFGDESGLSSTAWSGTSVMLTASTLLLLFSIGCSVYVARRVRVLSDRKPDDAWHGGGDDDALLPTTSTSVAAAASADAPPVSDSIESRSISFLSWKHTDARFYHPILLTAFSLVVYLTLSTAPPLLSMLISVTEQKSLHSTNTNNNNNNSPATPTPSSSSSSSSSSHTLWIYGGYLVMTQLAQYGASLLLETGAAPFLYTWLLFPIQVWNCVWPFVLFGFTPLSWQLILLLLFSLLHRVMLACNGYRRILLMLDSLRLQCLDRCERVTNDDTTASSTRESLSQLSNSTPYRSAQKQQQKRSSALVMESVMRMITEIQLYRQEFLATLQTLLVLPVLISLSRTWGIRSDLVDRFAAGVDWVTIIAMQIATHVIQWCIASYILHRRIRTMLTRYQRLTRMRMMPNSATPKTPLSLRGALDTIAWRKQKKNGKQEKIGQRGRYRKDTGFDGTSRGNGRNKETSFTFSFTSMLDCMLTELFQLHPQSFLWICVRQGFIQNYPEWFGSSASTKRLHELLYWYQGIPTPLRRHAFFFIATSTLVYLYTFLPDVRCDIRWLGLETFFTGDSSCRLSTHPI